MPNDAAPAANETTAPQRPRPPLNSEGEYQLEPDVTPGTVPTRVLDELRVLRTRLNEAQTAFAEAIKLQSEKHGVKSAALRKVIIALGRDKVDEVRAEAEDIESLIEGASA